MLECSVFFLSLYFFLKKIQKKRNPPIDGLELGGYRRKMRESSCLGLKEWEFCEKIHMHVLVGIVMLLIFLTVVTLF